MLRLAGREATIVGLLTASTRTGTLIDDAMERRAASVEEKLRWVREGAGDRFPELELSMVATVRVADDRRGDAEELIRQRGWSGVTAEDVLDMPSVFIGSIAAIGEAMEERRARHGFSYYVVPDRLRDACAPIVARLAGR
jgi:hypothetical protein